ncbi:hypothetical protein QTG54_003990 [Skeletonema marinoi]|uniref:Uncharacterized protein n=1 Tax=Skeletonema marinoi TaxID=267567 RepID=A0AAD8YDV4_9STRA|nr:hypothetical protein QTG54_003990 [Skeletonema marinoi]|mmetsp:Transcript_23479/g.46730  ORF Transcript_23479/g.46730 Transcript_23479/m.46730 type:complete len:170 (-) Transcript_23479:103-612(-)
MMSAPLCTKLMHGLVRVTCKRVTARAATSTSSISRMAFSSSGYGESITYSGGQASEGQGGFYGSGGARVSKIETEHKPEMMALAADVENLTLVMQEMCKLEEMLEEEKEGNSGVTGKSLEISSKIKKIMTSSDVMDCLNRLEVEGEPVWGLSSEERDLVHAARQKVNEC